MARTWKGLYLATNDRGVPMLEKIAREKDAAYVYMQLGNVNDMLSKLNTTARMQKAYSDFRKREAPSFIDFESIRHLQSYTDTYYNKQDNFGNNY